MAMAGSLHPAPGSATSAACPATKTGIFNVDPWEACKTQVAYGWRASSKEADMGVIDGIIDGLKDGH